MGVGCNTRVSEGLGFVTPGSGATGVFHVGRRGKPSTWLPRPKLVEQRILMLRVYNVSDFL